MEFAIDQSTRSGLRLSAFSHYTYMRRNSIMILILYIILCCNSLESGTRDDHVNRCEMVIDI